MDERKKELVIFIVENLEKTSEGQIRWQQVKEKFSSFTGEVIDKSKLKEMHYNWKTPGTPVANRQNVSVSYNTKTKNRHEVSIKDVNLVNSPNAQIQFNIAPTQEPVPSIPDRIWTGIKKIFRWVIPK